MTTFFLLSRISYVVLATLKRIERDMQVSDDKSDLVIAVNSNACLSTADAVKYVHGVCMEVMYGCAP